MNINSVALLLFSPTGTTRRVAQAVADGLGAARVMTIDMAAPVDYEAAEYDLTVIGVPVYCSRVPKEATRVLNRIVGRGRPAVLLAVYGNNRYGDALLELKNLAESSGFMPVGAAAFIGEHSFSSADRPIAAGRPDMSDLELARRFGRQVAELLAGRDNSGTFTLTVPGNYPYCDGCAITAQPPVSRANLCLLCGKCVAACPKNIISIREDRVFTVSGQCIFCCACVKNCPVGARVVTDETILGIRERLYQNCSARREPETFLAAAGD